MFYNLHSAFKEFKYISKCIKTLRTISKTCEKVFRLNMTSTIQIWLQKRKSQLKIHITKQLLTSVSVVIRIYLTLKVILISVSVNITFSGR